MNDLSQAIVLYLGWGVASSPRENRDAIIDRFGESNGNKLYEEVQSVVEDLQEIEPNWDRHDLVGASKSAVQELSLRHIGMSSEAKSALEWLYSWWWK